MDTATSPQDLRDKLAAGGRNVLFFSAEWSGPSKHMEAVASALASIHHGLRFLKIDAEQLPEISLKYRVTTVPMFLFLSDHDSSVEFVVDGADAPRLSQKAAEFMSADSTSGPAAPAPASTSTSAPMPTTDTSPTGGGACAAPALSSEPVVLSQADTALLKSLVNRAPVMLFMKGTPSAPRCGFSRQMCELLVRNDVAFDWFDILENPRVRETLKVFSEWPTFPQLYRNGELVGGLDIAKQLEREGKLARELK
eukprot:gnl/Spiro4/15474_TR8330_c0_g1_i1.p1 gnl/Spiro4/15474_TR8330_c0_g1~~gnl/Spiro4/15474_TR8330_c0_g1_i1.p1  ORF type:complete len:271 (+),score=57.25 gnl/Spiro4/15474_TR8330_c0_g1_i1:57-815(+)